MRQALCLSETATESSIPALSGISPNDYNAVGFPREQATSTWSAKLSAITKSSSPDGRFLMIERWVHPPQPVTELHLVINWFEELKELVPIGR